ncbi:30S ribosomal protein S11 [Candidatus Kuenenbacteria bacterium]|nr:30S ribosomal protein S11 [Candidatus Kuenenbacteria bacterium]
MADEKTTTNEKKPKEIVEPVPAAAPVDDAYDSIVNSAASVDDAFASITSGGDDKKEEGGLEFSEEPVELAKKKKEGKKGAKPKKGKKKKVYRQVTVGAAYIKATYNNTIVSLTDQAGNVISFSSAGANGFRGPKKATPYAATVIVRDAAEKAKPYGLKDVNVFVRGVGMGRESAVRALNANGLNVLSIKDVTPIPHNGCRKRKPRRV